MEDRTPETFDAAAGQDMYQLVRELFPICRSITGDGVRQTLDRLEAAFRTDLQPSSTNAGVEFRRYEVPSGTPVLDWTVPDEWNVRDAYIRSARGDKVVDFQHNNLHLVSYSEPLRASLSLEELEPHLHSLPDKPDHIPYRTSYYKRTWGFCLSRHQRLGLRAAAKDGPFEVVIDSTLEAGALSYGEIVLPGQLAQEVLISAHCCHPSLANDNLSALAVTLWLARRLAERQRRYTYRIVYAPGTIGAITWLARNPEAASRVAHGLVAANLGDGGAFTYKKSRRGDAVIDRAVVHLLTSRGLAHSVEDFVPFGYDERQYGSPGFDLPVGCLSRTAWGRYPEYHTSADNLDLVRPEHLATSLDVYLGVLGLLEGNRTYRNLNPRGEPQLGRRGLYRTLGGGDDGRERELALLWVLNQSDGSHDLLDIAERSGMRFSTLRRAADALLAADLLEEVLPPVPPPTPETPT